MGVGAGGHDAGSGFELGDDLGVSFGRTGGHGNDGLASGGEGRPANEVDLAADAGNNSVADRVGRNLTCEVDFHRRIYGDDFWISGDCSGGVDVADIELDNGGIVVDKAVEFFGSNDKSGNSDAGVDIIV